MSDKNPMEVGQFFLTQQVTVLPPKDNPKKIVKRFEMSKGHFIISVILGQVKPGQAPPDRQDCMALLGSIGLVGLDDVAEALGDEQMQKVIGLCMKKYNTDNVTALPNG